jgi:hypothetical protein
MAAQSLSLSHGVSGMKISDFTAGTSAPGTGDFELRWNTSNTNSKNISREEIIIALKAFERALQQGGTTVDVLLIAAAGTAPPPAV